MYNPAPFREDRIDVLHDWIRQHPFAILVTCGANGPEASHVPVVLHADAAKGDVLRCHLARANPQWRGLQGTPQVLAILQGPDHYITPAWYPSKAEHGKVVPTWNYVAVHVRGHASIFEQGEELLEHLRALTEQSESGLHSSWSVTDAPASYIEVLSKGIVGVEIAISTIEGKWKLSQNRPAKDRQGVMSGLRALGSNESGEMAGEVESRKHE